MACNGFDWIGEVDLREVDQIGWFAQREPELIEWLKRCLLIAQDDGGSGCYWFLDADSAGEHGEWHAYVWWPGDGEDPESSADFAAVMAESAELAQPRLRASGFRRRPAVGVAARPRPVRRWTPDVSRAMNGPSRSSRVNGPFIRLIRRSR